MAQNYGLIRFTSNKELDELNKPESEESEEVLSSLASHIQKVWQVNRQAKEEIEEELLTCLRQVKGEYDPDTLAKIRKQGGSEIYMQLTAAKKRAGVSWIREIMLPAGDRPWGIEPTPIPELPEWANRNIAKRLMETLDPQQETGEDEIMQRASEMRDQVMKALKEIAEDASDRMSEKIADQLAEGKWDEAVDAFINDFMTFPSAFIKGPILRKRKSLSWGGINDGYKPKVKEEIRIEFERISPFDIYPSPDATEINDGGLIERIRFSRGQLYDLIGMKGYSDDAIRAALEEYGRHGLKDWLWRDYERAQLEDKDYWWLRADASTIDGIHYWGTAQGLMLLEWGMSPSKVKDPLADYHIDAIKVGGHIIRAVINKDPLQRRPYHKTSFEKIPGSFWGQSIPYRMRDISRMCNAVARAISNNLGISSGPQVEINVDRLAEGEVLEDMYPWKYWQTTSDMTGSNQQAIRFFQPRSNATELMAVYDKFEQKADDATAIPKYSYGGDKVGGAGRTSSGLSMLLSNVAKGIKLAISNIDVDVVKPIITMMYTFNMINDSDPLIKGDAKIVARGASAILIKEQAQMRHTELLGLTANPFDMEIIGKPGRAKMLRGVFEASNLTDVVPSDDEIMDQLRLEQEQGPPPDPEKLKLDAMAQADKAKLDQEHEHHGDMMTLEEEKMNTLADTDIEKNKEKLSMEERIRIQELDREDQRDARRYRLDMRKGEMAHDRDMAKIKEEINLERELKKEQAGEKEPGEKAEKESATVIQLNIDNKTGSVKKHIKVNRGNNGLIESGDVTETPLEEA